MSTKQLLRHAKTLYNCGIPHLDRHNQRAWVRSVIRLGHAYEEALDQAIYLKRIMEKLDESNRIG